jgi:tetratricopeptide (TPR) repeat protein
LAAVTFDRSLAAARQKGADEAVLSDLADAALAEGREDAALPLLRAGAERSRSALLWQWTGLLERALDEHERALESFGRAAALAPSDRSIAHGRARVALEAGLPAEDLFAAALRLSPSDGDVQLGYVAALFANGRLQAAEGTLAGVVARSPLWIDGHMKLAQLRSRMGKRDEATASLEQGLRQHPGNEQLWTALFRLHLQGEQFAALDEAVARARATLNAPAILRCYETIAAAEQGDTARADCLFGDMSDDLRRLLEVYRIRHLLRSGRVTAASEAIDAALKTDQAADVWPYAATAWRLTGDSRWEWLEGDLDRLVSVIDLTAELPDLALLEQALRKLHVARGEYLDQSVRGGSQTDGPLFSKVDPAIRQLRRAIVSAVERHVANLPPPDPAHPLLAPPRGRRVDFSGSWSVLLRGSGYHANHVHPQGWISSALYIRLPEKDHEDAVTAGWLTLGQPQAELGLNLPPFREIEPRPGRLVLFPSTMWHGTRPFAAGERLTAAFDVRRPL